MKALIFNGPYHMAVEDRPDPRPGVDDVVVRVLATGICGSDLHGYTGENGRRVPGQIMGHEMVGRVEALGGSAPVGAAGRDGRAALEVGELVTVNPVIGCGECRACAQRAEQRCARRRVIGVDPTIAASFAEYMAVPNANIVSLSPSLPEYLGAFVEPLAVGYHAARRGAVDTGSAVLVIGGGPIGQAAALASRRLGAHAVVLEVSPARADLVRALGFDVIDPRGPETHDKVRHVLGGPPDIVIDAVGASDTVRTAMAVSDVGATIVLVGMNSPDLSLGAYAVSTGERTLIGSFCYGSEEFAETADWVAEHAAELGPLLGRVVPLGEAPQVFAELAAGSGPAGKVLVTSP